MSKDKADIKIMKESVGLKAMFEEIEEEKKCKGVKKAIIRRNITRFDYKICQIMRGGTNERDECV